MNIHSSGDYFIHLIEFMELRIPINDRRKQFAGISRDYLCDFQYGIQYQFPYPVRGGQFESIPRCFTEECSDGLVGLKPFHRAKYIVLHHGQREAGNLCREVHALTSAEVEQLLAIVISHLGSPAGSVRPICLKEAEREVRGEQAVPLSFPATLREEQTHGGSCKLHVYGAVDALKRPVVLGESLLLELFDDLVGRQVTPLGVVRESIYFSNFHAPFKLTNDETKNQEVIITWSDEFIANNQEYFDKHPSFKHFADHIVYQTHKGDQSVGRYPDGGNSFYVMNHPTIGQTNDLHSYDTFIGTDTGVKIEEVDDIKPILAKDDQISVRFAGTKLLIQGKAASAQLDIYSIAGLQQQSQTLNLTDGSATISTSDLPSGIYIARVKASDGSENSCKFVIR